MSVNNLELLGQLFTAPIGRDQSHDHLAIRYLHRSLWFAGMYVDPALEGILLGNWMVEYLRSAAQSIVPNYSLYVFCFDKLEILMTLSYLHYYQDTDDFLSYLARGHRLTFPAGPSRKEDFEQILQEITASVSTQGDASPYPRSGIAGTTHEDWTRDIQTLRREILRQSGGGI